MCETGEGVGPTSSILFSAVMERFQSGGQLVTGAGWQQAVADTVPEENTPPRPTRIMAGTPVGHLFGGPRIPDVDSDEDSQMLPATLPALPPLPAGGSSSSLALQAPQPAVPGVGAAQAGYTHAHQPVEAVSMAGLEIMMRRLLAEERAHIQNDIKDAIEQRVSPLRDEITAERTERTQQFMDMQAEIKEIREQLLKTPAGGSSQGLQHERRDEIVIGGFHNKSKQYAITACQGILRNVPGNPRVLNEKVGNVPRVVPVKFDTASSAMEWVERNKAATHFPGFWCNISQTEEERKAFKTNLQPLFKVKRAIIETVDGISPRDIVIDKVLKQVRVVDGDNLKFVCEVRSRADIQWDPQIPEHTRERAKALLE